MKTMKFLSTQNIKNWKGKTCLLRIDLNVEPGGQLDSFRLDAVVPTIKLLVKSGVRVVLVSHRGRPKGVDHQLSLRPFAPLLSRKLKMKVEFIPHQKLEKTTRELSRSTAVVVLLENLRFLPGEETNSRQFAKQLSRLGNAYVNDAFAVSHRADASVDDITKFLPSYAGLVFEREVAHLGALAMRHPHPFTIIVGGAKISDKIGVLSNFKNSADTFLLAGGPGNTFFMAQGLPVGDSLVDKNSVAFARQNLKNPKVALPLDVKVHNRKILDVGPRTLDIWRSVIKKSRTIIWNGPVGLFEKKGFEEGTKAIWRAILKNSGAQVVVGGGETTASLKLLNGVSVPKNVFISTGGGAMLEFLSGKKLPGIVALR